MSETSTIKLNLTPYGTNYISYVQVQTEDEFDSVADDIKNIVQEYAQASQEAIEKFLEYFNVCTLIVVVE